MLLTDLADSATCQSGRLHTRNKVCSRNSLDTSEPTEKICLSTKDLLFFFLFFPNRNLIIQPFVNFSVTTNGSGCHKKKKNVVNKLEAKSSSSASCRRSELKTSSAPDNVCFSELGCLLFFLQVVMKNSPSPAAALPAAVLAPPAAASV